MNLATVVKTTVTRIDTRLVQSLAATAPTIDSTVPSGKVNPVSATPANTIFPSAIHVSVFLKIPRNERLPFLYAFQTGKMTLAAKIPIRE